MAYNDNGMFLPTTFKLQAQKISSLNISRDVKDVLRELYVVLNDMAININLKDTGIYGELEYLTGQTFFSDPSYNSTTPNTPVPRPTYRKVINFGALPNATTKSVAHGITVTSSTIFTRIYGCASDGTANSYLPIPYSSTTALNSCIELYVDGTNVNIKTGANYSSYNGIVVLEYLKS